LSINIFIIEIDNVRDHRNLLSISNLFGIALDIVAPFFSRHIQKLLVAIIDSIFDRKASSCHAARLHNVKARLIYPANPTAIGIGPNGKAAVRLFIPDPLCHFFQFGKHDNSFHFTPTMALADTRGVYCKLYMGTKNQP
jgi:hypothetical protein